MRKVSFSVMNQSAAALKLKEIWSSSLWTPSSSTWTSVSSRSASANVGSYGRA